MFFQILVAISLLALAAAGNGTRCFDCTALPNPGYCTHVTECPEGEVCAVEQYITAGGLVLYNNKCESTQQCSHHGKRLTSTDTVTCKSCCYGEFCNDQGCGSRALQQPQRGPLCFACDSADNPKHCRTIARCNIGYICMLTKLPQMSPDGHSVYKSSCETPTVCEGVALVGRKRDSYCHVCCTDDFCNDECNTPTTTASPTTTTPTTAAATTTTTITTTTTTPESSTTMESTTTTSSITTMKPTTKPVNVPTKPSTTTTPVNVPTKPSTTMSTTTTTKLTTTTTTKPTTTTTKKPTTILPKNPQQYCVHHNGYHYASHSYLCYKFHHEHALWNNADNVCKKEGGTLAIIDNHAKWNDLVAALKHDHHFDRDIWIGGLKDQHTGHFMWPNGQQVTFAVWEKGQPNGGNCINLDLSNGFQWRDKSCGIYRGFVCTIHVR